MLQTVDFLKFPGEPLFQTHQYKWVFDRVVQYRNLPITLLKSDFARKAFLAILQNRKTRKKYFRWSQFSV